LYIVVVVFVVVVFFFFFQIVFLYFVWYFVAFKCSGVSFFFSSLKFKVSMIPLPCCCFLWWQLSLLHYLKSTNSHSWELVQVESLSVYSMQNLKNNMCYIVNDFNRNLCNYKCKTKKDTINKMKWNNKLK
jgi:hypothetical protein